MLGKNARQFVWVAAALALFVPAGTLAQWESQRTIFTFSDPVTVPGHTLAAGTYEFRVADGANRHLIQVFDKGGSKIIATMFAIPALRNDRPKKAEIRFLETPAEMPAAVQSWWYPGMTTGHEFIYKRDQALRLAKTTTTGVLTDDGKTRIMPSGEEVKVESSTELAAPASAKIQEGEQPTSSAPKATAKTDEEQPVRPPVTTTSPEAPPKDVTMPHTAGSTSGVGVLGLVLFCCGLASMAVNASRRRPF